MNCIVCAEHAKLKYKLYDDRYGYKDVFPLYQCSSCHHKFIKHGFSDNDLGNLYTNYYPRSELSIDDYKPLAYTKNFKSWLDGEDRSAFTYVPKGVKILDIGCGFGQSLGYHKERGCDIYGVEADSNIKKVSEKYSFNVKVGLFDAADYENDFFDYITMDQVLEHTVNSIETMQGIAKILKKEGTLVISIPNSNGWGSRLFGKKWINWHAPYHLQHFSEDSMNIVAEKANLKIVSFKTITSSEWLYYQWLSLISFPERGEMSFFWNTSKQGERVDLKVAYKLLSVFHKTKINHIITRFFDVIGCGDNYIVILKRKE